MRRYLRAFLFVCALPAALHAIDYNSSDVQSALQRHDIRQLQSLAITTAKPLRLEALEALVRLRDPQVVPFLSSQVADSDPDIVQTALWGLPNYCPQSSTDDVIAQVQAARNNSSIDVRKTAETVLQDLQDPDKVRQMRYALLNKDSEQHDESLEYYIKRKDLSILMTARDMLQDSDPFLKQGGIILIHGLDDRDHLDAVEKLLSDPSPEVRAAAVLVVGDWKEAQAFEPLKPLLRDTEPAVRSSVITLLGKHQNSDIADALAGLRGEKNPTVRIALAKALAQFATPAGTDALMALALDDNPLVRDPSVDGLVAFNLAEVTHKMVQYLTDKTSRKRRRAAIAYLSNPGVVTPPAMFLPLLHDKDAQIRADAVQALLRMPGNTKAQLVYLLDDPQKDIRLAILKKLDLLLKIPTINKRVIDKALGKLVKDKNMDVQTLAMKYKVMAGQKAAPVAKNLPGMGH